MKASNFEYHRPNTRADALALMAGAEASVLAGGQSLMPMMNFRLSKPETLVDINAIVDLAGVERIGDRIVIGAMTRYSELEKSSLITEHAPLVATALPHIAHPAIRNRGTIGGSCALGDPAAEMPAVLLALEAEIELQSAADTRRVAVADFFLGIYETSCAEDELVVAIHLPLATAGQRSGFYEITRRHGDYAMAGCAIVSSADLTEVRIAFFGVTDRPVRVAAAEAALGRDADVDGAIAALDEIDFAGDMNANAATKKHLAGVALRRSWAELMA